MNRITAKTFVLPISEDMFFPVRDHEAEQAHIANSELRVVDDILGHLGLFGVAPTFMPQIDQHLNELLAVDL
jgi:homoserine O-acetyltransferase